MNENNTLYQKSREGILYNALPLETSGAKMNIGNVFNDPLFYELPDTEKIKVVNFLLKQDDMFLQLPPEEQGKVRQAMIEKVSGISSDKTPTKVKLFVRIGIPIYIIGLFICSIIIVIKNKSIIKKSMLNTLNIIKRFILNTLIAYGIGLFLYVTIRVIENSSNDFLRGIRVSLIRKKDIYEWLILICIVLFIFFNIPVFREIRDRVNKKD